MNWNILVDCFLKFLSFGFFLHRYYTDIYARTPLSHLFVKIPYFSLSACFSLLEFPSFDFFAASSLHRLQTRESYFLAPSHQSTLSLVLSIRRFLFVFRVPLERLFKLHIHIEDVYIFYIYSTRMFWWLKRWQKNWNIFPDCFEVFDFFWAWERG